MPGGNLFGAWHAGRSEKKKGLSIWGSTYVARARSWEEPRELANTEDRTDCDPVVFFDDVNQKLWLFYQTMHYGRIFGEKYRTGYSLCTIKCKTSGDFGRTWSQWKFLRNNWFWVTHCRLLVLDDGSWLLPLHREMFRYQSMFYKSTDHGRSWRRVGRLRAPGGCLEPSVVQFPDGHLLACMRTLNGFTYRSESFDGGERWTAPESTGLFNPRSAVNLLVTREGFLLLAFNDAQKGRTPLTLAASRDGGHTWCKKTNIVTEPGQYSYPAFAQADDGDIHVIFTWNLERIAHLAIPSKDVMDLVER